MRSTLTACGVAVLAAGTFAMAQDAANQDSNRDIMVPPGTAATPLSPPARTAPVTRNSADAPAAIPTGGGGGPLGTLYFSEDNNGNGLYIMNMANGAATNIGTSGVTSNTVGLAPAGDRSLLYGSKWSTLLHINSDGSGAVDVGGVGTEGLAYDGGTGTLYGAINGNFFTVNPADGSQSAILAAAPGDVEGIAYGNGGVYGLVGIGGGDTNLYFYDPGSDAWSVVGNTGVDWSLVGLGFNALEGALYAKGAQDTLLYRINPANGATSVVGDTGLTEGGGLAWLPPAPGGEPILWGLSSTSLGRLYTIDASGAATLVTALNGDASFTGLSFLGDALYGSDLIGFPGASGTFDVGRIDTSTGAVTFVSDQAGSFDWHGLASNETTGELYSIDIDDGTLPLKVLTPDGTVTTVGTGTGIDGRGMAYDDANGILYATDSITETLHRIDVNTGIATLIGPLGVFTDSRLGLAYVESNGRLYMNVGGSVNALYLVNTSTGQANFIGPNGVTAIDGLAWRPPSGCGKALLGAANGMAGGIGPSSLYQIDSATGASILIGPIGFDNVSGLAFTPDGTLYGSANGDALFGDGLAHAVLVRIDPITGAGTLVGELGNNVDGAGRFPDITVADDGTLYGYGDFGQEGLYRIDPDAGGLLASFVGPTGFFGGGNGLDFAPDGTLYATPFDLDCLVVIDPLTGAGACVPGSEGNVPNRVNALDHCTKNGGLFGSWNAGEERFLVRLDPNTGLPTSILPTVQGLDAIAFWCPPSCPWDLNGNGFVDFPDLLNVLSNWGPCPGCAADFDGNGFVAFGDLLAVLSNWGRCPGASPASCQPAGACGFFAPCGGTPGCICTTTPDGGTFCVDGTTACGDPCDDGMCPDGFICLLNTCCGPTTCVPLDSACATSPGAPPVLPVGTETITGVMGPDGEIYTPNP